MLWIFRYSTFVGDGDAKSFHSVTSPPVYGEAYPIRKQDCIGHVQKRMGSRLRKWKGDHRRTILEDGKGVAGASRLTDTIIDE